MKRLSGAPEQATCSAFSIGRHSLLLVRLIAGLFLVIGIATVAGGAPWEARAVGPAMFIAPASAQVGTGFDVTLDIDAADIGLPGIGGYVITLSWDPSIASLTSLTDAGWVTGGDIIVFCSTPTIDNALGVAELDCTPLNLFGVPGVTTTAPQVMAQAVFHGQTLGITAITLDGVNTTLLDNVGDPLASTISNGSLAVVAGVGGVAAPPDLAAVPPAGNGRSRAAFAFGTVALASISAGGLALALRRRRRSGR